MSNLTELDTVYLCLSNITGDIAAFTNATKLVYLRTSDSQVYGNISALANKPELSVLQLYDCPNLNGDISSLRTCTNLTSLHIQFTSITGSVNNLSNLTNLRYLQVYNTNKPGNVYCLYNWNIYSRYESLW